jgi:phosphatidylserine decarboxylase
MIVGRITVSAIDARDVPLGTHVIDPGLPVAAGGEIGMFPLGSTAVVFVEKDRAGPFRPARVGSDSSVPGRRILMGEPLVTAPNPRAQETHDER